MSDFRPISHAAVNVLARIAARKEVIARLRDEGRRVSLIKTATITALANEYLANNPQLYADAHARARRGSVCTKKPRRRAV